MLKLMTSVFACLATSAAAQTPNLEAGGDLFLYFCAECHGKNGRQAGPLAEWLSVTPPDLARLSFRNGGSFPYKKVAERIDGRKPGTGHIDMPVFGFALEGGRAQAISMPSGQTMFVSEDMGNVIAYLLSLQVDKNE